MPLPDDVVAVLWKQHLHLFPCPCLLDAFARWFCSYTCISFLLDTLAGWFSPKQVCLWGVFPRRGLLARSFHSLQTKPWSGGCARCNGGWFCGCVLRVFKCVSPAFAELDALAFFARHVYMFLVFFFLSFFSHSCSLHGLTFTFGVYAGAASALPTLHFFIPW